MKPPKVATRDRRCSGSTYLLHHTYLLVNKFVIKPYTSKVGPGVNSIKSHNIIIMSGALAYSWVSINMQSVVCPFVTLTYRPRRK